LMTFILLSDRPAEAGIDAYMVGHHTSRVIDA